MKPITLLESRKKDLGLDLSDEDLRRMYTTMVRTRKMDDKLNLLQRQGRIGFYLACTGQEAIGVGSAYAMEQDDWFFPHYRDQSIPLLKGIEMERMVHQCFGNAKDNTKGRQMPVHYSFREINYYSISSPLGVQIIQAAGAAYAQKVRGTKDVSMVYFGDGTASEGDFHSGMNFAAVTKSPCIFMLENNQYAISVPLDKQHGNTNLFEKGPSYGMPGVRVDGNDVLAMYQATKEAIDRARNGEGPTLIEAVTFRMAAHSTSDDPSRYVSDEEYAEWKAKDPIARFEKYLLKNGIIDQEFIDQTAKDGAAEIDAAIKAAEKETWHPEADTLFEDVYADLPPLMQEQLEQMRADVAENGIPGGHH
ncbi:MAG: thiamine pyrophosphate-dependent dehydrogenase E1 component subunit alpha [Thermoplasmatota archaeon]